MFPNAQVVKTTLPDEVFGFSLSVEKDLHLEHLKTAALQYLSRKLNR